MKILIRGAGDLATGIAAELWERGHQILMTDVAIPLTVRREVAFSRAVYEEHAVVEGIEAVLAENFEEAETIMATRKIAVMVDEKAEVRKEYLPDVLVDGIMAKKNLGTNRNMASLTVALGPGFEAGKDVDFVIETQRGHNLGRVIRKGSATPNTGIPGVIAGYGKERVIHSPAAGIMHNLSQIGDIVEKDQILARVDDVPVYASLTGVLRGIIRDGYEVPKGMKIADIDPRQEQKKNCDTISDKARCIAGSVVEILLSEGVLP
jgi:xanthine dehydrogenase accessory factor